MKLTLFRFTAIFTFCILFSGMFSFAQSPEKISYQSVIRDASGELVRSQTVGMQISILQGSASGTAVYVETHTPATNVNGLATIEVGNSTPVSGTFSSIDWSNGPCFLKVETDPAGETNYAITGTTEIMSVPYALYSKKAETVETETQTLAHVAALGNSVNTQLKNVSDPTDDQDAATKMYVDNLLSTIQIVQNGFVDPRDGSHYKTVLIGTQLWMAENLAWLPEVNPPAEESYTDSYYYVYGYSGTDVSAAKATANYTTYGVLYNWPAATTACPSGWHLPDTTEWNILEDYLIDNGYGYGGSGDDIGKALASTTLWSPDGTAGSVGNDLPSNNSSGFGALPGGARREIDNCFSLVGYIGYWWSATEGGSLPAWSRYLVYNNSYMDRTSYSRERGCSVRCLRD